MREACKFNVQIHNGNILMSSVTKDPGVSSNLLFSGSGINFPRPLYVNICLYWCIYVCMYHLEYMYIVSAYEYMLAYGSNLLAYMAHAVSKPRKNWFHCLKKTGTTFIFGIG